MKNLSFILLLSLTCQFSFGQSPKDIDSLTHALTTSTEDTQRVLILTQLARSYAFYKSDSAFYYASKGIQLAKKINFSKGEALCLMELAVYFRITGASAEGMQYAIEALPFFEKMNDIDNIVLCNLLISWTFEDQGDYENSLKYVLKITPMAIEYKSKSIYWCYTSLSELYTKFNLLDSAMVYGMKANSIASPQRKAYTLKLLGDILLKMRKVPQAQKYFMMSIAASETNALTKNLIGAFDAMSSLYYQKNQVDSAIYFAKKAMSISRKNKFLPDVLKSATFLTELYRKKGINDSILVYMQQTMIAKDSLFSKEKVKQFQSVVFKEQLHKQEIEAENLQYKRQVQIALLFVALAVVLLIAIILYRHDRQKQKANMVLEKTLLDLKQTQNQLIQKEKLASLGELAAGIAHEIQNPLNFVNNFSEVNIELIAEVKSERLKVNGQRDEELIDELLNDITQNEERITNHGKRATNIVKGMLEHSRNTTSERVLTDINQLADEYLRLSFHGMRAKNKDFTADFKTDFDPNLPKIEVVPQEIGRVILNLINNAFYAVSQRPNLTGLEDLSGLNTYQPTVTVSTKTLDNQIEIKIKDNGDGISKTILAKIFQPFFTTKPTGEGTGLGLSLSYDIVTKGHGGTLEVVSVEGEGAEFIVRLPIS